VVGYWSVADVEAKFPQLVGECAHLPFLVVHNGGFENFTIAWFKVFE
jgi:hypothetical protein